VINGCSSINERLCDACDGLVVVEGVSAASDEAHVDNFCLACRTRQLKLSLLGADSDIGNVIVGVFDDGGIEREEIGLPIGVSS
jgi:hypothetical protein